MEKPDSSSSNAGRYTTSRLDQESLGGLAYKILDTGATGGIVVSPLGLQEGAKRVAASANIVEVHLDENSNLDDYILSFLNKVMVGAHDHLILQDSIRITMVDKDGNVTVQEF